MAVTKSAHHANTIRLCNVSYLSGKPTANTPSHLDRRVHMINERLVTLDDATFVPAHDQIHEHCVYYIPNLGLIRQWPRR